MGNLEHIDVSSIEELSRIANEKGRYQEYLRKAREFETETDSVVFRKVLTDYQNRLKKLEAEAEPTERVAQKQYHELATLAEQLERGIEDTKREKDEMQLRRRVGELTDDESSARVREFDQKLDRQQAELAELVKLTQRFVEVYSDVASETPPVETPGREVTEVLETTTGKKRGARAGNGLDNPDKTLVIPVARLVRDETGEQYHLGNSMTIGRDESNQIQLNGSGVSRLHASVTYRGNGFFVKDENSHFGTLVNEEKVTEHLLTDGDTVRIGAVKMIFRLS